MENTILDWCEVIVFWNLRRFDIIGIIFYSVVVIYIGVFLSCQIKCAHERHLCVTEFMEEYTQHLEKCHLGFLPEDEGKLE